MFAFAFDSDPPTSAFYTLSLQTLFRSRLSAKGLERCASLRIQKRGLGLEAGAVNLIPQQRMADVGEMHPDLMGPAGYQPADRKSTRLNSSHVSITYAVSGLKKKTNYSK